MPSSSQFHLRTLALAVLGSVALSGCAMQRLKRDLRRKELVAVQAASPKTRARLSPKWRRRYASLLAQRGQVHAARLWWLGSYLRGADLQALEALAVSYARRGEIGFAAAQFAQIVATQRGALQNKALACAAWTQRKKARIEAGAFVSAQRDARRLAAICGIPDQDQELAARATEQRMARSKGPALIYAFSSALVPSFLDPGWRRERLGAQALDLVARAGTPGSAGQKTTHSVAKVLLASPSRVRELGPWLERENGVRTPHAAKQLLSQIGRDPTLGADAAGLTALLAMSGHTQALSMVQDNLRASSSLISAPSARLRVVLALVQENREGAIFWMRLGASQAQDLGAWWLWCARWAQLTRQQAAAKVAYQSLTKLVAPQSPARWTLSWWRLLQRVREFPKDPYLRADAPSSVATASLRAHWQQFLASLPKELAPGVWPALVDALVLAKWEDAQIVQLGVLLLGPQASASAWQHLLVSRAKLQYVREHPRQALDLDSVSFRGLAWRQLWSQEGINAASIARYWGLMEQDSAWSPSVDPLAALSVLISRPIRWSGQH